MKGFTFRNRRGQKLTADDPTMVSIAGAHATAVHRHHSQRLMTEAEYANLELRYAELQRKFALDGLAASSLDSPAFKQYIKDVKELIADGFDLPKPNAYVVATFPTLPRNVVQSLGRSIYYRNPRRYHCLLPLLGETALPRRPGHVGPGLWHRPQLRS